MTRIGSSHRGVLHHHDPAFAANAATICTCPPLASVWLHNAPDLPRTHTMTTTLFALLFCAAAAAKDDCLLVGEGLPEGCRTTMDFMAPHFDGQDGEFRCLREGSE